MAALDDFLSFLQGASNSAASAVSAPVDGINWALGKVGVPVSKKPVGGSEWLKELGFTAEPKNKTAGLLGEAVGGVLPIVAQAKAPQIAAGINQMISNAQAPRALNPQTGAIVWHGSPHKFDKFDSSKIGTGEGAQAYGHGLYLAESPEVAKGYMTANNKLSAGEYALREHGFDLAATKKALHEQYRVKRNQEFAGRKNAPELAAMFGDARQSTIDALKDIRNTSIYKVDLPDEHIAKMLDWDKSLSQQSDILERVGSKLDQTRLGNELGVYRGKIPAAALSGSATYGSKAQPASGADLYRRIANSQWAKENPSEASALLRDAGIPGIRYLDGGSRGVGQGTSNFVIFPQNEGLLTILERNGQRLP